MRKHLHRASIRFLKLRLVTLGHVPAEIELARSSDLVALIFSRHTPLALYLSSTLWGVCVYLMSLKEDDGIVSSLIEPV